jgi:hypothetical protein
MNKNIIKNYPYKWFGFFIRDDMVFDQSMYISYIPTLDEFIDHKWNPNYKNKIIQYLNHNCGIALMTTERVKCLLCEDTFPQGEYGFDGVWLWPIDLIHYIESHNVRIPKSFEDHIIQKNYTRLPEISINPVEWPWPEKDIKMKM